MKIHCIRHVDFEGPGVIGNWASENGIDLEEVRLYNGQNLPDPGDIEGLVIMGGPMSVNDEDKYSWLAGEKELIRKCADADKPVLGICLGAQLIANSLGSKVYPSLFKEIGWWPVHKTPAGKNSDLLEVLPERFTTFHWHGETFNIPEGAEWLAGSAACANQAFSAGNALGLQFHLEMDERGIKELSERCASELVEDDYIQTGHFLDSKELLHMNHEWMKGILSVHFAA